jgi:hypothetical protein
MVLCSSCDGVPLKFLKKNGPALQFTSTDFLSLLLTPLRIRWTIPLSEEYFLSLMLASLFSEKSAKNLKK